MFAGLPVLAVAAWLLARHAGGESPDPLPGPPGPEARGNGAAAATAGNGNGSGGGGHERAGLGPGNGGEPDGPGGGNPDSAAAARQLGALIVLARWTADGTPAAGAGLVLEPAGGVHPQLHARSAATGPDGSARIEGLEPGPWYVRSALGGQAGALVPEGAEETVVLQLPPGPALEGLVVDAEDRPVAGAGVWIAADLEPGPARIRARTGADGSFSIPCLGNARLVGARAAGHGPSYAVHLEAPAGSTEGPLSVRLELGAAGGSLRGRVLAGNAPAAGAVVEIDPAPGKQTYFEDGRTYDRPPRIRLRADAAGEFAAEGLEPGLLPMHARAAGWAPWSGFAEVVAGAPATLEIRLQPGVVLEGRVQLDAGEPAGAGLLVWSGTPPALAYTATRTAADGSYRLGGLPAGGFEAAVDGREAGVVRQPFESAAGQRLRWDPVLRPGERLAGYVFDADGLPFPDGWVHVTFQGERRWTASVRTDARGHLELACPWTGPYLLEVCGPENPYEPLASVEGARAGGEPLEIRLPRPAAVEGWIAGRAVLAGERPASGARVWAAAFDSPFRAGGAQASCGADGVFRLGPLWEADWRLWIEHPDAPVHVLGPLRIEAAAAELELGTLTLAPGGTLAVALRAPGGSAVEGLSVFVTDPHGALLVRDVVDVPGEGLTYTSVALAPGDYTLQVHASGLDVPVQDFAVAAGEETYLEALLVPGDG